MKLISVFILFVCVVAATFSQALIIVSYELNESFIAKNLCVNRSKPEAHCNGKCFLDKQLDKEDTPGTPLNFGKEKFEVQLYFIEQVNGGGLSFIKQENFPSTDPYFTLQEYSHSLFHPPCFS